MLSNDLMNQTTSVVACVSESDKIKTTTIVLFFSAKAGFLFLYHQFFVLVIISLMLNAVVMHTKYTRLATSQINKSDFFFL